MVMTTLLQLGFVSSSRRLLVKQWECAMKINIATIEPQFLSIIKRFLAHEISVYEFCSSFTEQWIKFRDEQLKIKQTWDEPYDQKLLEARLRGELTPANLDYLRARYYDSNPGRLISKDAYLGYLNDLYSQYDYQYAHANLVSFTQIPKKGFL